MPQIIILNFHFRRFIRTNGLNVDNDQCWSPLKYISFGWSLLHFNGWQPGWCLSYSEWAKRWNTFVSICFVLVLSTSAQISTRIQKISHFLSICVGTQYHTENCCESWVEQIHNHFCILHEIQTFTQIITIKTNCTYGSSTSLSVSLSGLSLSGSTFSFSGSGSSEAGRGWDRGPLSTAGGASAGSCDSTATPWPSEEQQRDTFSRQKQKLHRTKFQKTGIICSVV